MLSSSSEMRSAGLTEKKHEPEPVAPILNEAESFSFGSDLEKVLRAHQEVPVTPGALVGPPATVHTTGETASEQTFFPSENPLAAAEKVEGDTASEPIVVPDEPFASVVSSDTIACHYQDLVEAARQVFARGRQAREPG